MKSFAFVLCLLLIAAPARAGSEFVGGFDDLPLMPGMTEQPGELMTFVGPTGRIVENTVAAKSDRRAVLDFYAATLPQLGWRQSGPHMFAREDETLRLEFLPPDGVSGAGLTIRFILRPAEK